MITVLSRAVAAGLLVCALVACGGTGQTPSPSTGALPPRPVTAPADRIAPCSMLTPTQQREPGLDLQAGRPGDVYVSGVPSRGCTWLGSGAFDVNIQFIPLGTELALSQPGAARIDVDGFGAVQVLADRDSDGAPACQVVVDTGPGQSIRVQALTSADKTPGVLETCRQAAHVASLAMTTILATPTG